MKRSLALILAFVLIFGLLGCEPKAKGPENPDISGKYELDTARNEAIINDFGTIETVTEGNCNIFYQIFVGSFSDSNGDGIGDLRGIINRMDYLNDGDPDSGLSLGIEGIWLTPIFLSPSYHKYDVTNYYEIDPQFGTMEDLKDLIALCHQRGVKLILDLVLNHTASNHKYFQEFRDAHNAGDTENPYYNYYSWTAEPAGGKTWAPIGASGHHYECNFSGTMPEPDFDNPQVFQDMVDVAKFYLDLGVDGFRFDAAKYIYFGENDRSVDFWVKYMKELRSIKPDIYTVGEVWDSDAITQPYAVATNCFNFSMSQVEGQIATAAKGGDVNILMGYSQHYIDALKAINPQAHMVTFIANHDTDRAAGFLPASFGHAQMAANLSILMPGSTFIYYGEEIGMKGARGGSNTDANRRLAMLWGDGDWVRNPEGSDYAAQQINGTVLDQLPDGNSILSRYKKLIGIRKANPAIAYGEFTALNLSGTYAGGYLATYQGTTVAVIHNTGTEEVVIDLAAAGVALREISAIAGTNATIKGDTLTLAPQTTVVLK